jgi:hypothetical protein
MGCLRARICLPQPPMFPSAGSILPTCEFSNGNGDRPRSARAPAVSLHAGSDFVRIAITRSPRLRDQNLFAAGSMTLFQKFNHSLATQFHSSYRTPGVDGAIKGPFAKPKCEALIHFMHDFVTRFVARQDESIVALTRSSVGQGGGIGLMRPSARLSRRELFSGTVKAEGNFVASTRIDERCRPAGLLPCFQRGS